MDARRDSDEDLYNGHGGQAGRGQGWQIKGESMDVSPHIHSLRTWNPVSCAKGVTAVGSTRLNL